MPRRISFLQAINEVLAEALEQDERVILLGEDISIGVLGQTRGLIKRFGPERVINTPIAESAFTGVAMGAAIGGLRPVVEYMFGDFGLLAMDLVCNQIGQWRYITGGQYKLPLVIRTTVGAGFRMGYGHSQSVETAYLHAPGLTLVVPSTPYDAKGLFRKAIRGNDPVIFFEHKRLLLGRVMGDVPDEDYTIPFGVASIKREGRDVTVVATLWMVHETLAASEILAKEGISIEVIDPRTLVPLDKDAILKSVRKTGRLVTVEESRIRCGIGAEIAAIVSNEAFETLKAPIQRVAAPMVPVPGSPFLEDLYIPGKAQIIDAVKKTLQS
ncbi:MAG: alpha-ketoacid dehydrogenase subunit beta [Candidatus Methanomethylicaceae archaeon]